MQEHLRRCLMFSFRTLHSELGTRKAGRKQTFGCCYQAASVSNVHEIKASLLKGAGEDKICKAQF